MAESEVRVSIPVQITLEFLEREYDSIVKDQKQWLKFIGVDPDKVRSLSFGGKLFKRVLKDEVIKELDEYLPYIVEEAIYHYLERKCGVTDAVREHFEVFPNDSDVFTL